MSTLTRMIKQAAANLAEFVPQREKVAFLPTPGGQIPPPPGGAPPMDPSMGGMPPGAPPMDPSMGGMPPGAPPMDPSMMDPSMMDPAMMGGMPPGAPPMDPSMMGPPPGEPPPGEPPVDQPANDPNHDYDNDGRPDVMVPLGPITDFATKLIEATKGKRTADAAPPSTGGEQAPMDPQAMSPIANIGGPPAEMPGQAMPKLGSERVLADVRRHRGY